MQRTHRPTSHKKDPMKQYQGAVSRAQGKHFEEYIDLSLRYYEQRGEAVVEKTPEPMRPTKDLGNGKFIAYYEKLFYHIPKRRNAGGGNCRQKQGTILGFPTLWGPWCQSDLKRSATRQAAGLSCTKRELVQEAQNRIYTASPSQSTAEERGAPSSRPDF